MKKFYGVNIINFFGLTVFWNIWFVLFTFLTKIFKCQLIDPRAKKDVEACENYQSLMVRKSIGFYFINNKFVFIDIIMNLKKSINYYVVNSHKISRVEYRLKQTEQGFYVNFIQNNKFKKMKFITNSAWSSIWKALRYWFVALLLSVLIFYYLVVLRLVPFNKIMFIWICVIMFTYWLISGFVFFVKKYQFGKYTSAIQRFWRRSYILFWLLEGGLFLVFFYLTINASSESFYMFDQTQFFKSHLFSWRFFLLKLLPITFLIVFGFLYLNSVRLVLFSKNTIFLIPLTGVLTYIVWIEFYQFFHIIHFYSNLFWVYDLDEHSWVLENELRHTRIINNFTNVLLLLKFWHIIIIYLFWVFFLLRSTELNRVRYPLLSANLQNFIILYLFTWVSMYPWIKFYFRKFLDVSYFWFFLNNHQFVLRGVFIDLKLIYFGISNNSYLSDFFKNFSFFKVSNFFYWNVFSSDLGFDGYKKNFIKNTIVNLLVS